MLACKQFITDSLDLIVRSTKTKEMLFIRFQIQNQFRYDF